MRPWLLRPPVDCLPSVSALTGLPLYKFDAVDQHELAQARRRRLEGLQCHRSSSPYSPVVTSID
jgi:hypothetical protein